MVEILHGIGIKLTNKSPLVSIVLTTFNRRVLLQESLEAILNQSFGDFELLIVDNFSSDGTQEYVKNLDDKRIRYFRNNNHGCISINRNFGLSKTNGKYICFCDDDDIWIDNKLEKQIEFFMKNPTVDFCCTNSQYFSGKDNLHSPTFSEGYLSTNNLMWRNSIATSSVIVKREVFSNLNYFDESGKYYPFDDYEFWLRISIGYKIYLMKSVLIRYRVSGLNYSPQKFRGTKLKLKILISFYGADVNKLWLTFCVGARILQLTYLRFFRVESD
nr:glycosyltransferase [Polynucleobacter sp. MWH-UH2A]